jgi:alginate O-acetyltransferase complex protein AlgI
MSFLDSAFLFSFLPVTLLLFGVAGRIYGPTAACAVLALATLVFCLPYGWPFWAVVVVSALINHVTFFALVRPSLMARTRLRWYILLGAIILNLGLLVAIKYGAVFDAIPGAMPVFAAIAAAFPVTVSFFTFQRIVMVLDAYQKRPETMEFASGKLADHIRLGALSLMFPNLIIGPIAYVSELGGQLNRSSFGILRKSDLEVGIMIATIGLAKKVLIADPMDTWAVLPLFDAVHAGHSVRSMEAIIGMLGFYTELYFDFSGYSDIAIGVARLFGLELPINFNSPLRASGIVDFWKRWHITLTRVIARLLFTPLAIMGTRAAMRFGVRSKRFKALSSWLPILVNFIVIGLWHGPRWTYVLFGLYQGTWFILESQIRSTGRWKAYVSKTSECFRLRAGQIVMFVLMVISFAIFRSESLIDFGHLMGNLTQGWDSSSVSVMFVRKCTIQLIVAFAIIWLCPNTYEFLRDQHPGILTWAVPSTTPRWMRFVWHPTLRWAALGFLLGATVICSLGVPTQFDYGGF